MLRRQKRYVKQSRDELRKQTRIAAGEDPTHATHPRAAAVADAVRFARDHPAVLAAVAAAVVGLTIFGAVTGGSSTGTASVSATTDLASPVGGQTHNESADLAAACHQLQGITGNSSADAAALAAAATTLKEYRNEPFSDPAAALLASVILDQRAGTYDPAGIEQQCASAATAPPASSAEALPAPQSQAPVTVSSTTIAASTTSTAVATVPGNVSSAGAANPSDGAAPSATPTNPTATSEPPTTPPTTVVETPVPDVIGYQGDAAGPRMGIAGLKVRWAGTPNPLCDVTSTSPEAGTPVPAGTTVTLDCTGGEVPDYTGGSCSTELAGAQSWGMVVAWNGLYNPDWYVTAQNPLPAAAPTPAGSTLTLTCGSSTEPTEP